MNVDAWFPLAVASRELEVSAEARAAMLADLAPTPLAMAVQVSCSLVTTVLSGVVIASQEFRLQSLVYFSGLVLKTSKPYSLFRFMDPFDLNMYLTMLAVIIGTAFLLSALDLIWPTDESSLKGKHRLCDGDNDARDFFNAFTSSVYHMTAATLGGEDYEWLTWPLKVLRIGMLLVVLVPTASFLHARAQGELVSVRHTAMLGGNH